MSGYQITSTTYGRLLKIVEGANEYILSDHNRAPVNMDPERIERSRRTAKGIRRRYYVADKRTFDVSWEDLPHSSTQTVDAGLGAEDLVSMYNDPNNTGIVELHIAKRDGSTEIVEVHITELNLQINNRYINAHYYDVSITFEEV